MKRLCKLAVAFFAIVACDEHARTGTEPRGRYPIGYAIGVDENTGASIETNQDDYAPGEIVHVVGKGWESGETVNLFMSEDPNTHEDVSMDAVADGNGEFSVHFYDVQEHDIGVTFTLTATGQTSGSKAVAVFTDGNFRLLRSGAANFTGTIFKYNSSTSCSGSADETTTGTVTTSAGGTLNKDAVAGQSLKMSVPKTVGSDNFSSWSISGSPAASDTASSTDATNAYLCIKGTTSAVNVTAIYGVTNITTTTAVAASPTPSYFGTSVTFTAAVTPASGGAATGSVSFYEFTGSETCTSLGSATALGSDNAAPFEYSTSSLSVGAHTISACFTANTGWTNSSGSTSHTVDKATTTLALSSDNDPATYGEDVKFEATITFSNGTATIDGGTVNFAYGAATCDVSDGSITGGTSLGSGTIASGKASVTVNTLPVGSHDIVACYGGNASVAGSTDTYEDQDVTAIATTTTLAATPEPSYFGQSVKFTATVTPAAGPAATGTVYFYEFTTGQTCEDLGSASPLGSDNASPFEYSTTTLSVGAHTITGCFNPDANWQNSSGSVEHTVTKAASSLTVTSDKDPASFGEDVKFEATVNITNGAADPDGGIIKFAYGAATCNTTTGNISGGTSLGQGTISSGKASVTVSTLPVGTHDILACYGGSPNITGSSGEKEDQDIVAIPTTTVLADDPATTYFGNEVTFTATVTPESGGAVTGAVSFYEFTGGQTCTALSGAVALGTDNTAPFEYKTSSLSAGSHTITACFVAGAGWLDSHDGESHTVSKATTSLDVTSSLDPATFGLDVTFEATVTITNGAAVPTGSINFAYGAATCNTATGAITGGTSLGSGTIASGKASVTANDIPVGTHDIVACYGGTSNIAGSTDKYEDQDILPVPTTTALDDTPDPSFFGNEVTFTAVVTPQYGSDPATGTVRFYKFTAGQSCTSLGGASALGTDNTSPFEYKTSSLAVGAHTVTACFDGSTNFADSEDSEAHTVNKATSAMVVSSTNNPSEFGENVTLQAAVTITNGTVNPNGGTVNFAYGAATCNADGTISGGTSLGSGTLAGTPSKASVTINDLPTGTHTVLGCYGGNANIVGSSDTESQRVDPAVTSMTVAVSPSSQQYSDRTVLTATITPNEVLSSALTGTTYFYVGTGAQACGTSAPSGSVGSDAITDADDGVASYTYAIDKQPNNYVVSACFYSSNANFANSTDTENLTVTKEDATVFNESANGITIGNSGTLTFDIRETNGSAVTEKNPAAQITDLVAAGDIGKITGGVVAQGKGVLTNTTLSMTCGSPSSNGGSGYSKVLSVTCSFGPVGTADTYDVDITINNTHYSGIGAAIVQVSDPASGFATGGGWYYYDSNGERVNFGFMAKATVNKSKTNYQGSLLVIRHKSNGDVIKIKSNVFEGYSIKAATSTSCPAATFSGKATYSVNGISVGNYAFTGYGEDCGEPGTTDKFSLYHAYSPNAASTSATLANLIGLAKGIQGGNIQVPKQTASN
jgi:large repetitive protein